MEQALEERATARETEFAEQHEAQRQAMLDRIANASDARDKCILWNSRQVQATQEVPKNSTGLRLI